MNFLISNTFTDSLTRLSNDEQKAVKTTVFDLQLNPANPGFNFHKLSNAKDHNFWSVRVNKDIRIIVHRTEQSLLLCYVDHHDKAYKWAEGRKMETHPKTGAAQIVNIREKIKEIEIPKYVEQEQTLQTQEPLFKHISDEELLSYGVPYEWLPDVKEADENKLLELIDYLPEEASESLMQLAVGEKPAKQQLEQPSQDPFEHPDAQRRFRVMENKEEIELALNYPWEKWSIFLHPEQKQLVEYHFNGPARISGSAGTGKTVVALHRAVSLARNNPNARVLLTTFSDNLANMLKTKTKRLMSNNKEPRLAERLEAHTLDNVAQRLYNMKFGKITIADNEQISRILSEASKNISENKFSNRFLLEEWNGVVDAWNLMDWESYRDIRRLGRKKRLPQKQRELLWTIFSETKSQLVKKGLITRSQMFHQLADELSKRSNPPFDFAVVDEAQDISVPQLKFLASLGHNRYNSLFFCGDLGQRIFQQPFSWKALGIDIRGRSHTLKINYRTSHQIRVQADRLLSEDLSDVDGNVEERKGTISLFDGPVPDIKVLDSNEEESESVAIALIEYTDNGILPHEIGIFVRTEDELERAKNAIAKTGYKYLLLDSQTEPQQDYFSLSTMHLAKGLEFKTVIVMACDDEIIPLQKRIESVGDDSDLEEVYNTERNLLYVACTRARDYLMVTGVKPASEFLDDMRRNFLPIF